MEEREKTQTRTEVICVIDRSGSMQSIQNDAIGGFNAFLADQQAVPGDCRLTLVFFNDRAETYCFSEDIHRVKPLNYLSYKPSGQTALLDAIKTTIEATIARLKMENQQAVGASRQAPAVNVVMVILTDGEENASRYARRSEVFKLIHRCRKAGWIFLFLAANQDAIQGGESLGIDRQHSQGFVANSAGTRDTFNDISGFVTSFRSIPTSGGNSGGHNLH